MIILDVETTGLDPQKHSLISIGAVDFGNPTNTFYQECRIWNGAIIEQIALDKNGFTKEQILDQTKLSEIEMVKLFLDWLSNCEDMVIAGQNVYYDVSMIMGAASRGSINAGLSYRIVDQNTLAYAHMLHRGIAPPLINKKLNLNSDYIMEYVGIPTEPKPHNGLNGVIWEAEAFSRLLFDKSLLPQFLKYPVPWKS